jgi:glycosyltransferase involved in cell wall biosynthesis
VTDSLRVALNAESLVGDSSGTTANYIRALLRRVPPYGVQLEPVVAFHRLSALAESGLAHARRLAVPRNTLYRRWSRGHGSSPAADASVFHAPTLAFPPRGDASLVVTIHDLISLSYQDEVGAQTVAQHRAMLDRIGDADLVVVPSQATADALGASEYRHDRVRVVPMGTDLQSPSPDDAAAVLERLRVEKPYVLWIGTLDPWRNPEGVVRGFVEALDAGVPNSDTLSLYMVGPRGWWSSELADFVSSRGLSERVRRIDEQPAPARAALYSEASVFVFPAFVDGSAQPLLEAMACGAPIVTSNVSAMPEIAGAAAQICDPNSNASIGDAIGKVLRDTELASDLRRLGLRRAAEFTWDRTARETVQAYRDALASSPVNATS